MSRSSSKRRVLVITGSRSEFGLLRPVMRAIRKHRKLHLLVAVAGEHLLAPANTWKEVAAEFRIDARIPMQRRADRTRLDHAAATARGMSGFAAAYKRLKPDWIVVLGDRVEAFAAASAASIAGIAVCHIHGGDRAEGIADEAMRHAITKLAHLHCAATKQSANRIIGMGENPERVEVTGSPAIDGLREIKPMSDKDAGALGNPSLVMLMHPSGLKSEWEVCTLHHAYIIARYPNALHATTLWLAPNSDAGSAVLRERRRQIAREDPGIGVLEHLPRTRFIALLKRLASHGGAMIGNSSAGLVECSAIGLPVVDVGPRQNGREHGRNVLRVLSSADVCGDRRIHNLLQRAIRAARAHIGSARARQPSQLYGDGRASPRIAALLAKIDPHVPSVLRKRNSY